MRLKKKSKILKTFCNLLNKNKETYCKKDTCKSLVRKALLTKIEVLEKLNKIN